MNRDLVRYRRAVKRQLHCTGKTRRALLQRLQSMLDSFLDEHPAATAEGLKTAFGPPEAMASLLCEGLTEADRRGYRRRNLLLYISAGIMAAALLFFSIYVLFIKEIPAVTVDKLVIYDVENSTSQPIP